jgi:hypothetical protein
MKGLIESFGLLKGLPIAKFKKIESENNLSDMNFPYWMKVSIPEHKAELGAVKKCRNEKEAADNFNSLKNKFPGSEIIIQEDIEGMEMIIGLKQDRVFSRLLMIGFGGKQAEILRDVSFRALPIDKKEIEKMIKELKLYPLLIKKKYALDKFISLAEKISWLSVKELDLNPVVLNEKEAIIVDARAE